MNDPKSIINAYLDGELTAAHHQELVAWIRESPDNRKHFVTECYFHSQLQDIFAGERAIRDATELQTSDARHASVPHSVTCAPTTDVPVLNAPIPSLGGHITQSALGYLSSGWPVAYLVATVVLGIGLLIGTVTHVSQSVLVAHKSVPLSSPLPSLPSFVGRITGIVDCRWADPNTAVPGPVAVPLGRKYALASGLLEITYDTGAKVILQGPCTYEVESRDGGYLSVGKLTARVEKKAEGRGRKAEETMAIVNNRSEIGDRNSTLRPPTSALFFVRTPTAIVTDLGTEFGVEVDTLGNTTSHVFRGLVNVQLAACDNKDESASRVLHENESVRVEQSDGKHAILLSASAKSTAFVRTLAKPTIKTLDLLDVVAGGNGFSGRRNAGINPSTGLVASSLPQSDGEYNLVGDNRYHKVTGLPLIDGVFIPDGTKGPVQIDSAGHTFEYFAATTNTTTGYVWANGTDAPTQFRPVLTGVDYALSGHGALLMHANKGITFDLEAIRRANPGCKLLRFVTVAGNAEASSQQGRSVYADVWVFIDGRACVQRRQINATNGAFPIAIALGDKDRYLTLAATDGGNGLEADWIAFGDPRIELLPARAETSQDAAGHETNTSVPEDSRR